MKKAINITRQKFSHWTVLQKSSKRSSSGDVYWHCVCDCGTHKEIIGSSLRNGCTKSCGCGLIKNNGIFKTDSQLRRKYNINHDYFDSINSEEKAYWIGFIYADGWISARKTNFISSYVLGICLRQADINHLYKLRKSLYPNNDKPIYQRRNEATLEVNSKYLYNSLVNHGLTPNKSLTLNFPNIQEDLLRHFIRGYFDGDGWISVANKFRCLNIGFLGTYQFLYTLQEIFVSKLGINKINIRKDKPNGNIYLFSKTGKDALSICRWLYSNINICLDRKMDLYNKIQIIETPNLRIILK